MITPAVYDFSIYTDRSLNLQFSWTRSGVPVNLTGYSCRCFFRETVDSASPIIQLTSASNTIVLGGAAGTITLVGTVQQTAVLAPFKKVVYDLEVTDPSLEVFTLLKGTNQIIRSVTR